MSLPSTHGAGSVAPAILAWGAASGRKNLAWQHNPTRYRVWVSEIMLQQTQVVTVERYYDRFMTAFPGVADLAAGQLDYVLHLWSGLGYYARARNLHRAAQLVIDCHCGEVPDDVDLLQSLPGIGRSTAGAILALADNRRQPILDGNARRVYARVFGIAGWPGHRAVSKELWDMAEACTPPADAAAYTQAIMDLGATVCRRLRPRCDNCPLGKWCSARQHGLLDSIPGKRPKRVRPQRQAVIVLAARADGAVLLQKRSGAGIWGGLWCFPEIEAVDQVTDWCHVTAGYPPESIRVRPSFRHSFTHFDLDLTPVEARLAKTNVRIMDGDGWLWYKPDEPAAVGLAAPVARLLEGFGE